MVIYKHYNQKESMGNDFYCEKDCFLTYVRKICSNPDSSRRQLLQICNKALSLLIICNIYLPIIFYVIFHFVYRHQRNYDFLIPQVGDRLFSAFGQDTIDALFWTATEPRDRKREHLGVIPHLLFAVTYVCILQIHCLHQQQCR